MPVAPLPVGIARDDGEWTLDRDRHHLLGVGMDDDWPADPAVPRKALAVQSLSCGRPFQSRQTIVAGGSINVLYGGGLDLCHPRRIRIRLGGNVAPVSAR